MNFSRLFKSFAIALLLILAQHLQAQTKILLIGNSYTYYNEMPDMIQRLADVNKVDCEVVSSVLGGVSLKDHWLGNAGLQSRQLIEKGDFDIVVLQDQSLTPINEPKQTIEYGSKLAAFISSKGGKTVIYQTWPRKQTPETQKKLDSTFSLLAAKATAKVAPAAKAWHMAFKEYPNLELYDYDGSHPSEIGSYLAALMIYRTIFDLANLENFKTFKSTRWPLSEMEKCEWIAHQTEPF